MLEFKVAYYFGECFGGVPRGVFEGLHGRFVDRQR